MTDSSSIASLRQESQSRLQSIQTLTDLEAFQQEWLGRKGKLTTYLKNLGQLSLEQKKTVGKEANELKVHLEAGLENKTRELKKKELESKLQAESFDITLPGVPRVFGHKHPLSQVMEELVSIFKGLGFVCADGPEIESEFYNFDALNIPANHPARDMQDTFFLQTASQQLSLPKLDDFQSKLEPSLLRTHTSPVQVHIMQKYPPPIAIVVPGRVYRHEAMDATHSCIFHQLEGLLVDEAVSFSDLKGTLSRFAQSFFGSQVKVRFRPSFFPFTEPSAEMDISCQICQGSGCRVCKHTGWLEMLGSGMVNPNVFSAVKIDAQKYSGFAFGMGIERLAMFKYGVDDLRLFYENDMRFLEQF